MTMPGVVLGIRLLLAVVFGVAGMAKLADREGSRSALDGFGLPARLTKPGAVVLPLAELLVAAGLLVPVSAWWALAGASTMLAVFITAIMVSMARGVAPDCHCFGQLHSEKAGWRTLARNFLLAAVAGVGVAAGASASRISPWGWLRAISAAEQILTLVTVVLGLTVLVFGWLVLELLRQHGRILVRLEALEGDPASRNATQTGLPAGALAPAFQLESLDDQPMSLAALQARGLPVLLVFTDPGCGPCNALLPDVARWQRELRAELTIALVSRGELDQNRAKARQYALRDVLVQKDHEVAADYHAYGTPAAVVVTAVGRIASQVAVGTRAITALVEDSLASRPRPAAAPAGLAVGSDAPGTTLPGLDGRPVSLRALRGQPVVVLFWNPGCGFCQKMLPDLRAWEDRSPADAPVLLVICSGDAPSIGAMGLRSRVALDATSQTAQAFGASGTPSAVLIDSAGRIASEVAVGASAVLALAGAPALVSGAGG